MLNGKYKKVSTNFSDYKSDHFSAHIFYSKVYEAKGCGVTALSLVTGIHPNLMCEHVKDVNDIGDKEIKKIFKLYGIKCIPITKCEMTNHRDTILDKITPQHVVLISQLYQRNEASWGVLYDNVLYHNFHPCGWSTMELINRPILSAYVLWKLEWSQIESF